MKKDKLFKYIQIMITLIMIYIFYLLTNLNVLISFICFMMIHELGHTFTAIYYDCFEGIDFIAGNPGVWINDEKLSKMQTIFSGLSGMFFNLATSIIMINMFEINLFQYIIICIGVSLSDIIFCIRVIRK